MARFQPLNVSDHKGFCVRKPSVADRHFVPVAAGEFAGAAVRHPLLITKSIETGAFYVGALYGFRPGQNLFRNAAIEPFVPYEMVREGFYITPEEMLAIDIDCDRFSEGEGLPLFDADGEPSSTLRQIQHVLSRAAAEREDTDRFLRAMLDHRLIEPMGLKLSFDDGETLNLEGLYTISLDALQEVSDAVAVQLFRDGHLQLAYSIIGSLRQIPCLAQMRNRNLVADLADA